jgi:hypothetical protein
MAAIFMPGAAPAIALDCGSNYDFSHGFHTARRADSGLCSAYVQQFDRNGLLAKSLILLRNDGGHDRD